MIHPKGKGWGLGSGRLRNDSGQATVELVGMAAIVLLTITLLWQCVLVGYSMTVASRAADQAAREAAVRIPDAEAANRGETLAHDDLPAAWQHGSDIDVRVEDGQAQSHVRLQVPLILPGWASFPMTVTASSAARP